jgi:signal transduction histidine kinase
VKTLPVKDHVGRSQDPDRHPIGSRRDPQVRRGLHDVHGAPPARRRDEVLAMVAHDLRNPLNVIRMGSQSLLRYWRPDPETELERGQIEAMKMAADHMHRLVSDLASLVLIETGCIPVTPQSRAAGELFDAALPLLRPLADEKGIALHVEMPPDLPTVQADGERVVQVFSNLVGNAIKFSPEQSTITLRATPTEDGLCFSVIDQGPGIPAEWRPHLFEPHWSSPATQLGGLGLGLSIARGIVEAHGGQIWVESEVGLGSAFHFTLPLVGSQEREETGPAPEPTGAAPRRSRRRKFGRKAA